ncbi:MAG TPA: hypothetical protein VM492_08455 [Sumerlaeia bacterium]|nr:hypothetical protein [Sumerlaeia bacterium]
MTAEESQKPVADLSHDRSWAQTLVAAHRGTVVRASLRGAWLLFVVWAAWNSMDYVSGDPPEGDSGLFSSGGMHLLRGKALYRDVWDHKPPVVFLLNAFALGVGDGTIQSVRVLERVFFVCGSLTIFWIFLRCFGRFWLSVVGACLFSFHLSHERIFQGGNLTEEYAAVFVCVAIAFTLSARRSASRAGLCLSFLSGLFFSLAAFTKEPFLLCSVPWFCYLVLDAKGGKRRCLLRGGWFLLGSVTPAAGFVAWFAIQGCFRDWLDVLSYDLVYAANNRQNVPLAVDLVRNLGETGLRLFGQMLVASVAFALGFVAALDPAFRNETKWLPVVAVGAFAMDFLGTSLSNTRFDHYYMQMVPSFLLLAGCGAAYALRRLQKTGRVAGICSALALLALLAWDAPALLHYAQRLAMPARRPAQDPIAVYLRAHAGPGDTLWGAGGPEFPRLYLETGLLSPVKYFCSAPHHFMDTGASTAEEKLSQLAADLEKTPPAYVVMNRVLSDRIERWVLANYTRVRLPDASADLFVLKQKVEGTGK